ncbi:amidohydrolase family protein [Mycolicibacterium diernhoferi]|uniref:Amidohydrolase n=1 Tax=Mycolicibacterium diernhoferi TaxID=1801 RepID=A0A1Q4HM14_9MYCO|nr:amidohydrolase family protein [Mycolicibacterium diernhoferi]OJZ68441.1 amidohydrolase [Mycolicibacterium diernhoferi]OPE55232.1 amidohydrolase [Mycolicibacterium diernhoferi]PEG52072.1 amidohydrolase [Mycolicibacterium diernhoferi]QYL21061.1 amidohydrolase [Mycolicibacterium diernhoferi]
MPLQDHHQIVSVDDHLIEHPRVWQDRLPAKFRENGPQIVELDGKHLWKYDGEIFPTIGLNAVAGKPPQEWGMDPVRYEDMIPGCYDPVARIADMDLDGVQAALCFPSFPGFGGSTFFRGKDRELALQCVKAWNDFYIDEWCATAPDRYIPMAILPVWDIEATVAEAERVAAKGARTVSFPDSPVPMGLPSFHSDHWDGLWRVCSETKMPLSLHFGSGSYVPGFSFSSMAASVAPTIPDAPFAVAITLFSTNLMWTTVDLLFSGKLQKFPDLQVSLAEGGIGWVPYILERSDYVWERHRYYQPIDFDARPSDLFRQHFYGCFIDDEHGLANRHTVGVDRITLEIDFPHSDSNWPNSRKRATEVLAEVPDDECALIVEDNARRMLNFPRTA